MRAAVVAVLLAVAALASCSKEPAFEDRTARVTWGSRTVSFEVDGCLLDGQTAYVVGRSETGATVQAVIGVEADGETGVPESTGLTVDGLDAVGLAAFGSEAWERKGESGDAPGSIATARVKGSRIQATGEAVTTGADGQPLPGEPRTITFDSRCDETDAE